MRRRSETNHILITGTTGTGKSNAFHILIPQIRSRRNRAIVVDLTGDYISHYYQKGRDIILNPLDKRSKNWSPWADCLRDFHYDAMVESIVQPAEKGSESKFWRDSSRGLLATAMRKMAYQGTKDVNKLYELFHYYSETEFVEYFRNTEAATYASKSNERTSQDIRTTLATNLKSLRYLESSNKPFSIREWVSDTKQQGWIFITACPDQRASLVPLISIWVDIAINALMSLPRSRSRRLWFIIDELAALRKLPCLLEGLAEGRKYGACLLLGFQCKKQLEEIYGKEQTPAMLNLLNTKVFFNNPEPDTQLWISRVLGDMEVAEPNENISFGAHAMRDGVSLGHHTHLRPIVLPSELSLLENFCCYVKLPGNLPVTFLKMPLSLPNTSKIESFILKPDQRRVYA